MLMIRITLLWMALICSLSGYGQLPAFWTGLIADKHTDWFTRHADELHSSKALGDLDTMYYRTLCGNFNEGFMMCRVGPAASKDPDGYGTVYFLKMITNGQKIIYCSLNEEVFVQRDDSDKTPMEERAAFTDSASYALLRRAFKQEYHTEMNEAELFLEEVYYGFSCGFGGGSPGYKELMDSILTRRDRPALLRWLQSANTEKQLYAFDACIDLERKHIRLSRLEKELCDHIAIKEGTVQNCGYCIFGNTDIQELVSGIKRKKEKDKIGFVPYEEP